jgi:hypothetical protein
LKVFVRSKEINKKVFWGELVGDNFNV